MLQNAFVERYVGSLIMGIAFQPQNQCSYSFLREHVHEHTDGGGLAREILGLDQLALPDESPWETLCRFLYARSGPAGPSYVDIAFKGPKPGIHSLSEVIGDGHNEGESLFIVTGSVGSGKTAACVHCLVDIVLRREPFGEKPPWLAAWITDLDFIREEDELEAFCNSLGVTKEYLKYSPPVVFFFDLDRLSAEIDERPEKRRARLAQFVLRLSRQYGRTHNNRDGHLCVLMLRTQTAELPDQRFLGQLLRNAQTWSPVALRKADILAYLAQVLGDPEGAKSALAQLGDEWTLLGTPLMLTLYANLLRTLPSRAERQDPFESQRQLDWNAPLFGGDLECYARSPGRLLKAYVDTFIDRESHVADLSPREIELIPGLMQRIAAYMLDQVSFVIDRKALENAIAGRVTLSDSRLQRILGSAGIDDVFSVTDQEFVDEDRNRAVEVALRHAFLEPSGRGHWRFMHDSFRDFFCGDIIAKQQFEQEKISYDWSPARYEQRAGRVDRFGDLDSDLPINRMLSDPSSNMTECYEALGFAIDLLPAEKAYWLRGPIDKGAMRGRHGTGMPSLTQAQTGLLLRILRSHVLAAGCPPRLFRSFLDLVAFYGLREGQLDEDILGFLKAHGSLQIAEYLDELSSKSGFANEACETIAAEIRARFSAAR